jgi:hypothetical protein
MVLHLYQRRVILCSDKNWTFAFAELSDEGGDTVDSLIQQFLKSESL